LLNPLACYDKLLERGLEFFTGVPDSLLKDLCAVIETRTNASRHIIAANEGNALAIASGYYLATGKPGVVYLQNSGLGNLVNPLLSMNDSMVYRIPALLVIGWRGEPGTSDEPQHKRQGLVTLDMLDVLGVRYAVIDSETSIEQFEAQVVEAVVYMQETLQPYALVAKDKSFMTYSGREGEKKEGLMARETAIERITRMIEPEAVVVSTTGKTSRELFEIRKNHSETHAQDFLTVGSMGHSSQIALGISKAKPDLPVYCLDGEGALLMHMGALAVNGEHAGPFYTHIVLNNGVHESVGGQPNSGRAVDLAKLAEACGFREVHAVHDECGLVAALERIKSHARPAFLEVKVRPGSRKDLGRPTTTPGQNKEGLMEYLGAIMHRVGVDNASDPA